MEYRFRYLQIHRIEYKITIFCFLTIAFYFCGCGLNKIGLQSSEPIEKSGILSSNEVWSGKIIIKGDVTVPDGVNLTIQPDTIVGFDADIKPYKLVINGTLYAEGNKDQRITFASLALEPQPGDWIGIIFNKISLNSRLGFCRFMHYNQMTCYSDSLKISNCIFNQCKTGLVCKGSSPLVESSEFVNNKVGISCVDDAEPEIRRNLIQANYNAIICDNASPTIIRNQIEYNYQHAIICYPASSPKIRLNNIVKNDGWAVYNGGELSENFISGNNKKAIDSIDTGTGRNSYQFFGVDEVIDPRKSPVSDTGPPKISQF